MPLPQNSSHAIHRVRAVARHAPLGLAVLLLACKDKAPEVPTAPPTPTPPAIQSPMPPVKPSPPPLAFGAPVTEASSLIEKHTNAEWLYRNYLANEIVPKPEIRQRLMPTVQKIANGFALKYAQGDVRGEEVTALITHAQALIGELKTSGQWDFLLRRIQSGRLGGAHAPSAAMLANPEVQAIRRQQEKLVQTHRLPYPLSEEVEKIIVYDPALFRSLASAIPQASAKQAAHATSAQSAKKKR